VCWDLICIWEGHVVARQIEYENFRCRGLTRPLVTYTYFTHYLVINSGNFLAAILCLQARIYESMISSNCMACNVSANSPISLCMQRDVTSLDIIVLERMHLVSLSWYSTIF